MAKCKTLALFLAVFVIVAASHISSATTLTFDPQFAIGTGLNTSCQTGQCGFFGGEVNAISGTTFDIWNTQNAQSFTASSDPILLVIGVPNTDGDPNASLFGSVTLTDASGNPDGTGILGGTAPNWMCNAPHNTMVFCGGNFNTAGAANNGANDWSGTPNSVGDFLANPDESSQGFSNWTGVEATPTLGSQTVSDFHIWVFELNPTNDILGQSGVNVNFSVGLPFGTLVYAEGCFDYNSSPTPDCGGNNLFFTPFTTAGAVTTHNHVPEPAGLALLGSGLVLLGGLLRRKLIPSTK